MYTKNINTYHNDREEGLQNGLQYGYKYIQIYKYIHNTPTVGAGDPHPLCMEPHGSVDAEKNIKPLSPKATLVAKEHVAKVSSWWFQPL